MAAKLEEENDFLLKEKVIWLDQFCGTELEFADY